MSLKVFYCKYLTYQALDILCCLQNFIFCFSPQNQKNGISYILLKENVCRPYQDHLIILELTKVFREKVTLKTCILT